MKKSRPRFQSSYIFLIALLVGLSAQAFSNQGLTYMGRIVKPDGSPENSGTVNFTLNVYDTTSNCILWSEVQTVSMANSDGQFALTIGQGTRTDSGTYSLRQVFVNAGTLSSLTCTTGNSYMPTATDDRKLSVTFNDGTNTVALNAMSIKEVPFAMEADQVNGYGIMNLAKISGVGSANVFSPNQHDFLFALSGAGSTTTTPCTSGQILKFNGTSWACANDDTSPSGGGITSLNGLNGATQTFATPGTTGTAPAWVSSGTAHTLNIPLASAASVTAGLLSNTDYAAFTAKLSTTTSFTGDVSGTYNATSVDKIKGTALSMSTLASGNLLKFDGTNWTNGNLAATDIPGLDASKVTAGTFGVTRGGTGATSFASNQVVVANGTGSALTSFTCSLNQVLSFDGSGNAVCQNVSTIYSGFTNGGNAFGANSTIGNTDNFNLGFMTNNTVQMTIDNTGKVGIGTTSPSNNLDVESNITSTSGAEQEGIFSYATVQPSSNITAGRSALYAQTFVPATNTSNLNDVRGIFTYSNMQGSGNTTGMYGIRAYTEYNGSGTAALVNGALNGAGTGSGTVTSLNGNYSQALVYGGHVGTLNGVYVQTEFYSGTLANRYGVYLKAPSGTATTDDFGFYQAGTQRNYLAGTLGIGTTSPKSALDINGAQTFREIAAASAPTPVSGADFIYADNSSHTLKVSFNGAAYASLTTGGGGSTGNFSFSTNTMSTAAGDPIVIVPGAASSATAAGNSTTLQGGAGGTTSGAGGTLNILGGTPTSGAGGTVNITGTSGVGTNQNGGNVLLTAGAATGAGTAGTIAFMGGNVGIGTISPTHHLEVPWKSGDAVATAYFGASAAGTDDQIAIYAETAGYVPAIYGISGNGYGVEGFSSNGSGVYGSSQNQAGILGTSTTSNSGKFYSSWSGNSTATLLTKQGGAGWTADLFQAQDSTGKTLFNVTSTGTVGIGTTSPLQTLDVAGNINAGSQTSRTTASSRGQLAAGSTYIQTQASAVAVDWNNGNLQEVNTFVCNGSNTITMANLRDGAAYSLMLSGTAAHSGNCTFSAAGFTFKTSGGAVAPTSGKDILFTFVVINNIVIYNMSDNLQ